MSWRTRVARTALHISHSVSFTPTPDCCAKLNRSFAWFKKRTLTPTSLAISFDTSKRCDAKTRRSNSRRGNIRLLSSTSIQYKQALALAQELILTEEVKRSTHEDFAVQKIHSHSLGNSRAVVSRRRLAGQTGKGGNRTDNGTTFFLAYCVGAGTDHGTRLGTRIPADARGRQRRHKTGHRRLRHSRHLAGHSAAAKPG